MSHELTQACLFDAARMHARALHQQQGLIEQQGRIRLPAAAPFTCSTATTAGLRRSQALTVKG